MPPFHSHAVRAGGREKRHGELQGERVHLRAVAGGWQVRKCHFRGLKHLRAVKKFPLTRVLNGELGEARLGVGLLDRTSLRPVMRSCVMPALVIGNCAIGR